MLVCVYIEFIKGHFLVGPRQGLSAAGMLNLVFARMGLLLLLLFSPVALCTVITAANASKVLLRQEVSRGQAALLLLPSQLAKAGCVGALKAHKRAGAHT